MNPLGIVNYGNTRYELQNDRRRVAIVDDIETAQLFAAAPELLARAEDALTVLIELLLDEGMEHTAVDHLARAIAKAKGE